MNVLRTSISIRSVRAGRAAVRGRRHCEGIGTLPRFNSGGPRNSFSHPGPRAGTCCRGLDGETAAPDALLPTSFHLSFGFLFMCILPVLSDSVLTSIGQADAGSSPAGGTIPSPDVTAARNGLQKR